MVYLVKIFVVVLAMGYTPWNNDKRLFLCKFLGLYGIYINVAALKLPLLTPIGQHFINT